LKILKNSKKFATETARGITALIACGFDVHLGRIDYPELEKEPKRFSFVIANSIMVHVIDVPNAKIYGKIFYCHFSLGYFDALKLS